VPLTLRRLPPNILIGSGARAFAKEHGMQILPNEALVSRNAHNRYKRWQEELQRADAKKFTDGQRLNKPVESLTPVLAAGLPKTPIGRASSGSVDYGGSSKQRDHTNAIFTATWNEGQPDSPYRGSPAPGEGASGPNRPLRPHVSGGRHPGVFIPVNRDSGREALFKRAKQSDDGGTTVTPPFCVPEPEAQSGGDGSSSCRPSLDAVRERLTDPDVLVVDVGLDEYPERIIGGTKRPLETDEDPRSTGDDDDDDEINDTIGAIAVDSNGRIAAASSSGGIGMKHSGRVGPAALVGIGTAVIPSRTATADDPGDDGIGCGVSVAAVTSGTGEHMATTMASYQCAQRIFSNTRMGMDGMDVAELDENKIMQSFILDDFMDHPSVQHSHSTGAIGAMAVKRTSTGIYFYFAHNTDSFALASIGGAEPMPLCVMSRLSRGGKIAQGGRRVLA